MQYRLIVLYHKKTDICNKTWPNYIVRTLRDKIAPYVIRRLIGPIIANTVRHKNTVRHSTTWFYYIIRRLTLSRHCGNQVAKATRTLSMICRNILLPGWRMPYAPVHIPGMTIIKVWIPGLGPLSTANTVNSLRMHREQPPNLDQAWRTYHTLNA